MYIGNNVVHIVPNALSVVLTHSERMPSFSDTFVLTPFRYAQGDGIRRIPELAWNGLKKAKQAMLCKQPCRAHSCCRDAKFCTTVPKIVSTFACISHIISSICEKI